MKLNFRRTPAGDTLWELRTTNTEDIRTLYFGMRAYRDSLHKQLADLYRGQLCVEDYEVSPDTEVHIKERGQTVEVFHLQDYDVSGFIVSEVPQVKPEVLMDNYNYEELAFLHELLMKVNTFLFEIMNNHAPEILKQVRDELDVI